ncbi:SulP family inorganic anion transporter [Polaromonas sp.]|uniref:SulP family inorganic anion transporter n=1 Tax=Polaromonas sp. TaxID=1869339 RepID=UPI003C889B54
MNQHSAVLPARTDWLRELSGGLITGVVAVVYAISYAALLFSGPLKQWLPLGIGLCLVSAMLGAFWLAWRSELPFAIAGPDGSTLSILAAMAATVTVTGAGALKGPLEHVLLLLFVTTLLCALLFLLLGFGRLGAWVRYVPFPVIGGFLASTGWLIAAGALKVAVDLPWGREALTQWPHYLADTRLLATVALAAAFLFIFRKERSPALLPLVLLGACAAFFIALLLAGVSLESARQQGWLLGGMEGAAQWMAPWTLLDTRTAGFDGLWLAGQLPDMLAVVFVAAITVLLGASGLEIMSKRDISLDHELRTHGWLNLLAACSGGCISLVSVSRSAVMLESGARTRAAGMLAAAVCGLAALGAGFVLGWIPKIVPAAFLLYIGLSILGEWVFDPRIRLNRADWALVLVILAITASVGFTTAVLVGMVAACLNFALNYSRVGVVQHDLDGTTLHSNVVRPAAQRQLLNRHGGQLRVLMLRGMIFFGSAHAVLERVRGFLAARTAGPGATRILVLDFSHVASADSSAGMTFTKISQLAQAAGVQLALSGLKPAVEASLAQGGAAATLGMHGTLDQALEAAEETLLAAYGQAAEKETLAAWMLRELGQAHWSALQPLLERRALATGQVLMHQGEVSDATLYLIESGRLTVTLRGQDSGQRLASLMGGTTAGEMGLYSSAERSATVLAERDAVVWALTRQALDQLQRSAPDTAMQVHAFVMRIMAERLRLANTTLAALQRGT